MHPMQQQNQMYGSSNMMGGQPQMNGYGAEMPQPMDMSGGMMGSNYSGKFIENFKICSKLSIRKFFKGYKINEL